MNPPNKKNYGLETFNNSKKLGNYIRKVKKLNKQIEKK